MNYDEIYNDWTAMVERKTGSAFISEEEFNDFCREHVTCVDDYRYVEELLWTCR